MDTMVPKANPPPMDQLDTLRPDEPPSPSAAMTITESSERTRRPSGTRCSTEPSPAAFLQGYFKDMDHHLRPALHPSSQTRNRSPYSRSHLRSRSTNASTAWTGLPLMTRAHSMPAVHTLRSTSLDTTASSSASLSPVPSRSPLRSPARSRSPFKLPDESHNPPARSPSRYDSTTAGAIEAIQEDSELDIPQCGIHQQHHLPQPTPVHTTAFARSGSGRRRPASPLHSLISVAAPTTDPNASNSSGSNSPSLGPQKYNEAFPHLLPLHHSASSSSFSTSVPSTPTSTRSRSPSISSLETIEDAPEMETEAIEEERERMRLLAEKGGGGEEEGERRRSSLDMPKAFTSFGRGGVGGKGGVERKRWSICGGERRADLDLETIWEV